MRFKEFLREKAELGEPKLKLTQADFDALPGPTAGNVEDRFKVGQDVVYLGFAAEMKPADFLNLATIADRSEDAKRFVRFIAERVPFASPFLELAYNEKEWEEGKPLRAEIKGHEVRGRMLAFDEVHGSNTMIPVAFILRNGGRARDLSPEFFKALRSNGIVQQDGGKIATPTQIKLGKIFWNGQTL